MSLYESDQTIGPGGALNLERLPFAEGQPVHVRIEPANSREAGAHPRVLGLHAGSVDMSDDFDAPMPDSFWLGTSEADEAPA